MKTSLLVAVSSLSLMWGGMALAQTSSSSILPIRIDDEISAELSGTPRRVSNGNTVVFQDYQVRLAKDQMVVVDLSSEDFDAYLELYREGETGRSPLVTDDDGAQDGTNARLRYVADRDGTYIIRARALSDGTGQYRLKLSQAAPRAYAEGRAVQVGESLSGELTAESPRDDDDLVYGAHSWTGKAGQRVALRLVSEDFDPVLVIGEVRGGHFVELDRNDDDAINEGSGTNSFLVFTAPRDGTYYIMARSLGREAEGRYVLSAEEGPKPAVQRSINTDDLVSGKLGSDTGIGFANEKGDQWRLSGRAGQRVMATLTSDDFDTFLELFDASGQSLASDDDGAGELNSRLVHVLPADGDYILEARSMGNGTGDYELTYKIMAPAPPPLPIAMGQTLEGELTSAASVDDDGHFYRGYIFEGVANQRIQATLRSGDFDALIELGRLDGAGGNFEFLARDDDGLMQGTDSRLNFTLPDNGRYEIRAMGLNAEAEGLYSIELMDRGPEPRPGSLLVPSTVRSSLTDQDSMGDDGYLYDAYVFRAKANDKLMFTLISADFDALVEVGEVRNETYRALDQDDDSLSDNHALLKWEAPRDGTYQVRVRSYRPNATGDYSLIVERQP